MEIIPSGVPLVEVVTTVLQDPTKSYTGKFVRRRNDFYVTSPSARRSPLHHELRPEAWKTTLDRLGRKIVDTTVDDAGYYSIGFDANKGIVDLHFYDTTSGSVNIKGDDKGDREVHIKEKRQETLLYGQEFANSLRALAMFRVSIGMPRV